MSPSAWPSGVADGTSLEPVAICGMACRLPGEVDSDSSFWKLLVEKRTGQTPKVPKSRFNIDAHYHENLERPGSFNVAGGYFLDGKPEDFDHSFFNMTPIEAQWLDPQQRKMLEVSYESLVSAGLTLDDVSGSNTAVFVGCFTADYQQMSTRDPDFRHNYVATGVDPGIISNRIGNTFNLNGPSFTINTACSSSVYALHNACHALRARDCNAAIAGGVNLIVTVDQHMNTAKLGILSPTSTCHTFDASADGYGRAEGVGALYLKRLSDAIRDCDPIRGVIRSTAVNTNGKVDGMGITHPSVKGQERVVRLAYEKANLNPNLTAYAELHGTGTPVGDPIEVRAISNALNDDRPKDQPLLIGAVKPNIGHSEAASGIFAVMKAALMTEAAVIPGVALFNKLNPEIKEDEWNVKVHADTAPWPKDAALRRASVSSFGYGGTNGHVVIESVDSLYPWYQHGKRKKEANYDHSSKKPFLVCFSAHDKATMNRNIEATRAVASEYFVADLAHTLNLHRTKFSHRSFAVVSEGQEFDALNPTTMPNGAVSKKTGKIGFLFTGQGAQWAGMGRVACLEFPTFKETIETLDAVLSKLNPAPTFKIADLLLDDPSVTGPKISDAEVAQPLCTAIQIAIVDLLAQWNIDPLVSIGHSSGEIAAAYAAGLVSAPEAMVAAFCRGRAVKENSTSGSMLAVGLGVDEVQEYLPSESEQICVACENSPNSVTLSGDAERISQLREVLSEKGIFARELKTGKAYHSPHMKPVGEAYESLLAQAFTVLTESDFDWRRERSIMISSVTGEPIEGETIPASYWSANLRQRVRFNTAVQRMGMDEQFNDIACVVEIGPHAALSGPFKQIKLANKLDRLTYVASMERNKDDTNKLLSVAGSLFVAGCEVDLATVNPVQETGMLMKPRTQYLLVDLPPYQWNYDKEHWAEPRGSAEQRGREYLRHDLLGSRVSGLSHGCKVWRNMLRARDVPWLKDHSLGGTMIFPAAGHMSVAIEALWQIHETDGLPFDGVTIRDFNVKTALVIPESNDGIEVIICLQPIDGSDWHSFTVESFIDDKWAVHCEGKISATHKPVVPRDPPVDKNALGQRVSGARWYDAFHRVGFKYTNTFQQLQDVQTDKSVHHAAATIGVVNESGVMEGESRYLIHPSTVDACLQLIIISIHSGKHKDMPWGVVPTQIEEVSLFLPGDDSPATGTAVAWTDRLEGRSFNTHTQLSGKSGKLLMNISNLTCVSYEAALPADAQSDVTQETFSVATWKPDIASLTPHAPVETQSTGQTGLLELIQHSKPIKNLLIGGCPSPELIDSVLQLLLPSCAVTIGYTHEEPSLSESALARTTVKALSPSFDDWEDVIGSGSQDVFLLHYPVGQAPNQDLPYPKLMNLVKGGGWLIGSSSYFSSIPGSAVTLDSYFAAQKTEESGQNGVKPHPSNITVFFPASNASRVEGLMENLSKLDKHVQLSTITGFRADENSCAVIDDSAGDLLLSLAKEEFDALKALLSSGVPTLWLTKGVKQGKCPGGCMAEGFLRVIRSEQAAARIVLLDVDQDENLADIAQAVVQKLDSAEVKDSGRDTEFWLHHGLCHIPRVYANTDLNAEWNTTAQSSNAKTELLPKGTPLKAKATDTGLAFEPELQLPAIKEGMIEIQVDASGSELGSGPSNLVSGKVIQAGPNVDKDIVGKNVVAFTYDGLRTSVRTSVYAETSGLMDFSPATLVATLGAIQPLVQAFYIDNKLDAGSRILSLPSSRPFTAMTILLARALGHELTLVVSSEDDRDYFVSKFSLRPESVVFSSNLENLSSELEGDSSLWVIAHDFSPLSQEIWRSIPASGRFLLLSKESLKQAPEATPFIRGASFLPVNPKALHTTPEAATNLLRQSLDLVKAHPDLLHGGGDGLVKKDDAGDLADAKTNDTMASVVKLQYNESEVKILPKAPRLALSGDATYFLVGCLGGLGRSLTEWMMERGARHFAFVSRSGADKPEAAQVIKRIEEGGAQAKVFRADASDENAVRKIVLSLNEQRPIRGVVHAAMVLKDGMFEQMDYDAFNAAVVPKAVGALSLHNAMKGIDLDFFVMTSSISAVLGNTGQSNYSAANSFLDSLALQRNRNGLAGTSLVLPMVLDVGVVAENDGIEASLMRKGLYGIDEPEMLRGFEVAMSRPRPAAPSGGDLPEISKAMESQLVMGMEVRELFRSISAVGAENSDLYWYNDARFCHIRDALETATGGQTSGGDESFLATLKSAQAEGTDAAIEAIALHIMKRMSTILMIPVDGFEMDELSLASYGLDSMIGAEMRTWLFKEFALDYPFQKLLAPTLSFRTLSQEIAGHMGIIPSE